MAAFKGAADVGAHALETDIHLSRDGVVVLSHVRSLTLSTQLWQSILTSKTGPDSETLLRHAG